MILIVGCALVAVAGLGLVALAVLWPRPSLSAELDQLLGSGPAPAAPSGWLDAAAGWLWASVDRDGAMPALRADLAVMDQTGVGFVRQTVTTAALFAFLAAVVTVALDVAGVAVPVVVAGWTVILAGVAGGVIPRPSLRADAQRRRTEMRDAVAVICDLTAVMVAAGEDLDGALLEATGFGAGWAFDTVRRTLAASTLGRRGPWLALQQLGERLAVDQLVVLAQNIGLAGQEGAKIREALATQATALRQEQAAEVEAAVGSATERMSFPMVLLLVGFILVIGYPAVTNL